MEQQNEMERARTPKGGKRRAMARRQRQLAAIIWMVVAVILLTASFFAVRYVASLYWYEDVDGSLYRIQRKNGQYVLCDAGGNVCDINTDKYYLTDKGTQLSIDPDTGEYTVYAVVELEGSEQLRAGKNVLLFPQLTYDKTSTNNMERVIRSIEVHNEYGTYTFYRKLKKAGSSDEIPTSNKPSDYSDDFAIKGFPDTEYDEIQFAMLASGCGYALAQERLEDPVRLKDGSIDWAQYGLMSEIRERTLADGTKESYEYTPAHYVITNLTGESHTVWLGDMTVMGDTYYARYEGRDRVYVVSSATLEDTAMAPIESMVTSKILYPMSDNTYYDVEDFELYTNGQPICQMSYIPLDDRWYKLDGTIPFLVQGDYMAGYYPNSDNIHNMLRMLHTMSFIETVKLGPSEADLKAYGLDDPYHRISFVYHVSASQNAENEVWISKKTESGLYYAYSPQYNMIVSFTESQALFLEWRDDMWYEQYYFMFNIAHLKQLKVQSIGYNVVFDLDNSASSKPDPNDTNNQSLNSEKLKVYADGERLNYRVQAVDLTGKLVTLDAVDNFRRFYEALAWASIEGVADLTEEEMADFRSRLDSDCLLILRASLDDGFGGTREMVIRFYDDYSERLCYMTVELLDSPDAPSDGTAAEGRFCVSKSFCKKLIADAKRAASGELVTVDSKN